MSKQDETPSPADEVKSEDVAAPQPDAKEPEAKEPGADKKADKADAPQADAAPDVAPEEAAAEKPKPRRRRRTTKKAAKKAAPEAVKEAVEEAAPEVAKEPAEEAAVAVSAEPDAEPSVEARAAEDAAPEAPEAGDAGDSEAKSEASADTETTTESQPRSRTRRTRTRSRRKSRSNDKSDDRSSDRRPDRKPRGGDDDHADDKPKLRATALWGLHKERRAKIVPFAGYEMPVQYKRGIMAEHRQTRERAGLFDVSHMGQAFLSLEGEGGHNEIAALLEELVPGNLRGLKPGRVRYTLLLNDEGGIVDDFMVTRPEGEAGEGMLFLVVNAGCKEKDFAYISKKLEGRAKLTIAGDRALIALQGPSAATVLARHAPFVTDMAFMSAKAGRIEGVECIVSRCGYTGEDGYEISLPNEMADGFARKLLSHREVSLVGLGARDSLRLEAGLCLYGHEIDEETTPVEADLVWTIAKQRRIDKDFPGAEKIMAQVENGVTRKRVGILPQGKAPARDGTVIVDADDKVIGKVTSGGFGPTVRGPIAMGYVEVAASEEGTEVFLMVRGQARAAKVVPLPFIPPRQFRPGQVVAEAEPVEAAAEEPTETPAEEPAEEPVAEETTPVEETVVDIADETAQDQTEETKEDDDNERS